MDHPQRELTQTELLEIVERVAANPGAWQPHVEFREEERVCVQLHTDDHLDVWLICWNNDQDTGFHDHDRSTGAMRVLQGEVREQVLKFAVPPASHVFTEGDDVLLEASRIHCMCHSGKRPAITLHAYSPPLERMGIYDLGPDGEITRTSAPKQNDIRPEADWAAAARQPVSAMH